MRGVSQRRQRYVVRAVGLVVAALAASGGCGLSTSGGGRKAPPCQTNADCDDGNICTTDRCDDATGECEVKAAPDGDPLQQIPGDCKSVTCTGGEEVPTADDDDSDDHNDCTSDVCKAGVASHELMPEGSACKIGQTGGSCSQTGSCEVICEAGTVCDDQQACTVDSCDVETEVCIFQPLHGDPTPGTTDAQDDCIDEVCLEGESTTVADDLEVPDDDNECTDDVCEGGVAINTPRYLEPCTGGVCNEEGECVECVEPSHCGGDGECFYRTCNDYVCGVVNVAAGPLPDRDDGDCHGRACDGAGSVVEPVDTSDVPAGDGNQCTSEECSGGTPVHPALHGQSCNQNGGKVCNNSTCVECLNNGHCTAPETCGGGGTSNKCGCTPASTSSTCSGKCGTVTNNCGEPVSCGGCTAPKSCGGGGTPNVCGCSPSSCCDGSENGNETDVDCGGGTCSKCDDYKDCNVNADCKSNDCHPGQHYCRP